VLIIIERLQQCQALYLSLFLVVGYSRLIFILVVELLQADHIGMTALSGVYLL